MNSEETEARIKGLERQVAKLNDIEDIQRLQRSYGFYIQHWMYQEIVDLFADGPETELDILLWVYCGKESVSKYYTSLKAQNEDPEFLHQLMQLSGIVDVSPDGKTAQGRWFTLGAAALTSKDGVRPLYCNGLYTSEYIKQNGVWKILKLTFHPLIFVPPNEGWVKKDRLSTGQPQLMTEQTARPDKPRQIDPRYPSGYIVPFHFNHPVTGKKTDVNKHNAALKRKT
jgi:hypothetical protein